MKILIVANYKESAGGISGQVKLLYENLLKEGANVRIFSLRGKVLHRLGLFFKLFVIGKRYDIFHIHACSSWGFLPAVVGVTIGKIMRKKIILTYHGGGAEEYFARHHKLIHFFLCKTDTNIVLSGFLAKIFDKHKIPYVIIPNILEFDSTKFRKREVIKPIYISVRTLAPDYNIQCIIRAFDVVKKKKPEAQLYVVSDGPCMGELKDLVKQLEIEEIVFTGKVPNSEIYNYLDNADVFVSSPLVDNQPMSVLEAFNAGLVVISSNVGGVPYMVEDGKTGILFESNNYKELADKMMWTIKNQELSMCMIQMGNEKLGYYSWARIKELILKLYK